MTRFLALGLAAALLGGCAIVPLGHGYRGDADWRGHRYDRYDHNARYDGYDRNDWRGDGRGWHDRDDRGR